MVNPTKVQDVEAFRTTVRQVMGEHGWDEPLWPETTPEDPGQGQAKSAVSDGVDLVLACGGDGTVTACAEGVTDTGVPPAIIPLGTGNLLARNIGLPVGVDEALAVALGDAQQPIDAGRANGTLFVVMAGIGLDARMLTDTSDPLKKRLGWRLPLLRDARPDDGLLDAVVLIAGGVTRWLALTADILLRRPARGRIYRVQFTQLEVTLDRQQPWELDGEVMGSTRQLTIEAQPGGLLLRMPPESL